MRVCCLVRSTIPAPVIKLFVLFKQNNIVLFILTYWR
jgi:hypothetical protein